jgi:signal transduction histidine kinase
MERGQVRRPTILRTQERPGPAPTASLELARATELLRAEIGDRQRAEQARLQLLNRLVFAEEEERRRIAREMHDQCGQDLTALRLQVQRLKTACGGDGGIRGQVDALEAIVVQLDQDIDFLVWELRPTTLEGVDLRAALAKYLQSWSAHFGIPAELHANDVSEDRVTSKIKSTLYRIAQEALTNVAKHANATHVDVVLASCRAHVSLVIEDHGVGFDRGDAGITGQGLGLLGMRERVALVAGTVQVESIMGRGTTILVRVPTPDTDQP